MTDRIFVSDCSIDLSAGDQVTECPMDQGICIKHLDFSDIKADSFADALERIQHQLYERKLITDQSSNAMIEEVNRIRRIIRKNGGKNQEWVLCFNDPNYIEFKTCNRENNPRTFQGRPIEYLRIILKSNMSVIAASPDKLPFKDFVVTLEIYDDTATSTEDHRIARWHIDLANQNQAGKSQDGTRTHIQFGGNWSNRNQGYNEDFPLKEPRWNYHPMDVILMCEMILANFFHDEWLELRDDSEWINAVKFSQKLCYVHFLRKMIHSFNSNDNTVLYHMDASKWF